MSINDIFYQEDYKKAFESLGDSLTIREISKDVNGKRRFQIVEIPKITHKELTETEIRRLKRELSSTDYVACKLTEAIGRGVVDGNFESVQSLMIEYADVIKNREEQRKEIRKLEEEISNGEQDSSTENAQ